MINLIPSTLVLFGTFIFSWELLMDKSHPLRKVAFLSSMIGSCWFFAYGIYEIATLTRG